MPYTIHHLRLIIGQKLHALRVERKLTLYRLARLSGVSERKLDHFELGKNEVRLEHLLKIAHALKIEINELLR